MLNNHGNSENNVIPALDVPEDAANIDLDLGLDFADLVKGEGHQPASQPQLVPDTNTKPLGGGGGDFDFGGLGDLGELDLSSLLGDLGDTHQIRPAPPPKGDGSFEDQLNSLDLGLDFDNLFSSNGTEDDLGKLLDSFTKEFTQSEDISDVVFWSLVLLYSIVIGN